MPHYRTVAPVQLTGSLTDPSGINNGQWTNAFTSDQMPRVNPEYEIYHMTVTGGPPLASATIRVGNRVWSTVQLDTNGLNEWDPSQPIQLTSGQEVYFYWTTAVTPAPVVTVWPRYDMDIARES